MRKTLLSIVLSVFVISSCTFEKAVPLPVGCTTTMYYATNIKPFIDSKCVTCHSTIPSYMNGGDFSSFPLFKEKIDDGSVADRVFHKKDMAPTGYPQLTEAEKAMLRCWIEQGATNN